MYGPYLSIITRINDYITHRNVNRDDRVPWLFTLVGIPRFFFPCGLHKSNIEVLLFIIFMCVFLFICLCMCICECGCLRKPKEVIFSETEVTDSCEPDLGTRN